MDQAQTQADGARPNPSSAESPMPVRVISQAIGDWLAKLGRVWIEGELTEVNQRPGAGVVFMRLKDLSADVSLNIMCHPSVLKSVAPLPANARVVMDAKVSWYAKTGSISMSVSEIRQIGLGELLARLEHLKNLLAAEGLFLPERKRALPFLPKRIGLICGRNSDAEKDVITNAKRRWPAADFEVREVAVAGDQAALAVTAALKELDAMTDIEVIVITRGGGSFEDLLPFSDEGLLRAVANAQTPIVSAIGHEKDAPLLDLVADYRASTPTDAGKRVVPDVAQERVSLNDIAASMTKRVRHRIELERSAIAALATRPALANPESWIAPRRNEINALAGRLRALSPQSTLDRGYSIAVGEDGGILSSIENISSGTKFTLQLSDGAIAATAD
jgi:exodeoxyribonuclease VII large subunit